MNNKLSFQDIVIIILGIIIAVISIVNIVNNKDFFEISVGQSITFIIAIFISFRLVQQNNKNAKQIDAIVSILIEMKTELKNNVYYEMEGQDINNILMRSRKIRNNIDVLKEIPEKFIKKEDIEYIYNEFKSYDDLVSDNISNIQNLITHRDQLKKHVTSIDSKLTSIRLQLIGLIK